jgi:hypothetical protein
MPKRSNSRPSSLTAAPPITVAPEDDVRKLVEGILGVLNRGTAEPCDGIAALLAAFMSSADQTLKWSEPADLENNRRVLLAMLERAREFLATWPDDAPAGLTVH